MLPETLPEEYEEVRNILTPKGLWQTFNGDEYDAWEIKVINLLKLQDFGTSSLKSIPLIQKSLML